jgi:hypothetical protein
MVFQIVLFAVVAVAFLARLTFVLYNRAENRDN